MAFATASDVAARWRPLSVEEAALAGVLIDDAEALIRIRVPLVDARLADGTLPVGVVTAVVARMVLRVLQNPEGYRSETEQIDSYSHSYTRDDSLAAGGLYLADDELAALSPTLGSGEAFTIRPYGVPGYASGVPDSWLV